MNPFAYAHAGHSQWKTATDQVLAQLRAQLGPGGAVFMPPLALLYITDHYADAAQDILEYLSAELPLVTDWCGAVGVGIASNNVEYFDEPALAVMLLDLPSDQFRVFSGVAPLGLGFEAHTALVHADAATPDLAELIEEMAGRTHSGYLFGGIASSGRASLQFAVAGDGTISGQGRASGVFSGGLSGVAFGPEVDLVSRVTQGCKPIARPRVITEADHNVVVSLDGEPALDVMLSDLSVTLEHPREALAAVRATLVGLERPPDGAVDGPNQRSQYPLGGATLRHTGNFGSDVMVRHIIGLDPARRGVAVADLVQVGMQLTFCQRNKQAAKADLVRICAEIREELEAEESPMASAVLRTRGPSGGASVAARRIAGAVYVSCSGRGGPHFGGASAEMHTVRQALGDVPLVGFFAGGEIARKHLYGYTGVLTVFATPLRRG